MRLIDADALKDKAFFHEIDNVSYVEEEDVDKAPTVDAVERKRGRWVKVGQSFLNPNKFRNYSCSECGYDIGKVKLNYCPSCGADMRKGEEE